MADEDTKNETTEVDEEDSDEIEIDLGNEWVSITSINDETVEKFKEYTIQKISEIDMDDLKKVLQSRRKIQESMDRLMEEVVANTFQEDDLLHIVRVLRDKNMKFIELATKIYEKKLKGKM